MIKINIFSGMTPAVDPRILQDHQAQKAINCDLSSGKIVPLKKPSTVMSMDSAAKSIFPARAIAHDANRWLWTDYLVSFARSMWPDDATSDGFNRIFWSRDEAGSGDGYPRVTSKSLVPTFSDNKAQLTTDRGRKLGVPTPGTAPTVTFSGDEEAEGSAYRRWAYSYVNTWGEEGELSPASAVKLTSYDDNPVITMPSNPTSASTGYADVVGKRVYRLNTNTSGGGVWQLVTSDVDAGSGIKVTTTVTSYVDSKKDSELLYEATTLGFTAPLAYIRMFTPMANGILAAGRMQDVFFCHPYHPYAWPDEYRMVLDYNIVGMASFGSSLEVGTEGYPYLISGTDPASMSQDKLEIAQSCLHARSMVGLGSKGVAYVSPDGIVHVGPGGGDIITSGLISKTDWTWLMAGTVHGYAYDNLYILFYDTGESIAFKNYPVRGALIFDTSRNDFTVFGYDSPSDSPVRGGHSDLIDDTLYLLQGGNLVKWADGENKTAVWRSKIFTGPRRNSSTAMVVAEDYPVTFKYYGDNRDVWTKEVANSDPFRLPAGFVVKEEQIEIETQHTVHEARVGSMEFVVR